MLGVFLALTPPPTTRDGIRRRPFVNRTSSRRAMQLRSIVDRRENELASHAKWPILGEKTQSWAKKRNAGRKNRVFGTFPERFYREGGWNSEKFPRAGKQFFCATQVIFRKPVCYYQSVCHFVRETRGARVTFLPCGVCDNATQPVPDGQALSGAPTHRGAKP